MIKDSAKPATREQILESLIDRVQTYRGEFAALVELSGEAFSYSWLQKFGRGEFQNPTLRKVDELRAALDALDARKAGEVQRGAA